MTKRRLTPADAAGLIFDVWVDNHATGMNQDDTLKATGLTPKQFIRGKEWLRDKLCSNKEMPYTYHPATNLYRLNSDFEPVEEYWLYRLKVTMVQLQRLLDGTASPAKAKFGGRKIERLHRHTKNLIEDLADILG